MQTLSTNFQSFTTFDSFVLKFKDKVVNFYIEAHINPNSTFSKDLKVFEKLPHADKIEAWLNLNDLTLL